MKILGLGHYSRTGKDTIANAVITEINRLDPGVRVKKVPFAWKLKQIAYELYSWDGLREPEFYDTKEGESFRDIVLPTIGKTPVQIWIDLGNCLRDEVYPLTWVQYNIKGVEDTDVLIIPDVRFFNEVECTQDNGDTTILAKVVRPGYGPRPSISDRTLLPYRGWNFVVGASGLMSELQEWGTIFALHLVGRSELPQQTWAQQSKAYEVETITPWEKDHLWMPEGYAVVDGRLVPPMSLQAA